MSDCCGSSTCSSESTSQVAAVSINDSDFNAEFLSEFKVPKMDCPSEEGIIRMAFDSLTPAVFLKFDIPNRLVSVFHADNVDEVVKRMESVGFGAQLISTKAVEAEEITQAIESSKENEKSESVTIKWLLGINAVMFVFELIVGLYAQSAGLIADALDMFADAAVYALALFAVGKAAHLKLRAAHISGWLQMILALGVLAEVIRRFMYGSEPVSLLMMEMGAIALIANIICLKLIYKKKDSGAHMKATWIFSANDVIANLGVIVAGLLVMITGSFIPDLVIGTIIGFVVLLGAIRILKLKS